MKLLIDIPQDVRIAFTYGTFDKNDAYKMSEALINSIRLDNLTNGEVLMKMFPYAKVTHTEDWTPNNSKELFKREFVMVDFGEYGVGFNSLWWNSKWGE